MEALAEQILKTGFELVPGELDTVFGLGDDIVETGFEPVGLIGNLAVVNSVSQL